MVVEPTKTNTTEVLGVGECFIEIKELRKLEGNNFIRKNIIAYWEVIQWLQERIVIGNN